MALPKRSQMSSGVPFVTSRILTVPSRALEPPVAQTLALRPPQLAEVGNEFTGRRPALPAAMGENIGSPSVCPGHPPSILRWQNLPVVLRSARAPSPVSPPAHPG